MNGMYIMVCSMPFIFIFFYHFVVMSLKIINQYNTDVLVNGHLCDIPS